MNPSGPVTSPSLLTIHFSSVTGEGAAFRIEQQQAVRKLRVAESVEQEMSIYPDDEKSMRLLEFAQDDDEVKSGQSDSSADEDDSGSDDDGDIFGFPSSHEGGRLRCARASTTEKTISSSSNGASPSCTYLHRLRSPLIASDCL